MSIPCCSAIRRARGVIKTRSLGLELELFLMSFAVFSVASVITGLGAAGSSIFLLVELSSPLKVAIAEFTLTPSVPSATKSFSIIPSSTASNSMVALSVSISARRSPDSTLSPSLTNHFANVPSSMVGESAGIKTSIANVFSLLIYYFFDSTNNFSCSS